MPLKEYQSTSYADLIQLLDKISQTGNAEIFVFFSCTLDKHGDPTTKSCFESEDCLMEFTEFVRGSKRSLHLVYFRMQLEAYYVANTDISRDHRLRVTEVPTLLKWQGYQRLCGKQCGKIPLLSMVFEKECPKKFPQFIPCYYFGKAEPPHAAGDGSTGSKQAVEGESGSKSKVTTVVDGTTGNNGAIQPPPTEGASAPTIEVRSDKSIGNTGSTRTNPPKVEETPAVQ